MHISGFVCEAEMKKACLECGQHHPIGLGHRWSKRGRKRNPASTGILSPLLGCHEANNSALPCPFTTSPEAMEPSGHGLKPLKLSQNKLFFS
jgi:hypothetical protein